MKRCAVCMSLASTARMKGSNLNTAGDSAGPAQILPSVDCIMCTFLQLEVLGLGKQVVD